MNVDEAIPEERPAVLTLTLEAYREYQVEGGPAFWERYCQNIRRSLLEGDPIILVARSDGAIKGSVLYCEPNQGAIANPYPEMRLLAVPPSSRNLGVGAMLIEACEQRAKPAGVLTLHTTRLMQTARAMYERRGYTRFTDIDFEPVPGFVVWGYQKTLTAGAGLG
ncbi:MAG TPA: GNAT family N-acetyltransferase [Candidatus Xenobia bacterium]|jgi:GNAT superfamily N-acetyltransferase